MKSMQNFYHEKVFDTEKKYDLLFAKLESEKQEEEKELAEKYPIYFYVVGEIQLLFGQNRLQNIPSPRRNLESEEYRVIKLMNKQQQESFRDFVKNYESDSEMNIGLEFSSCF